MPPKKFRHRHLRRFYQTGSPRGIPPGSVKRISRILDRLRTATGPSDLDLPGYFLEPLKGNRAGTWSVRVTANWRITFRFEDDEPTDIDLEDYH